jgi:hypothetical protein
MGYRVVHVGTGNIGQFALRAILRHPDLELAGHFVSSPQKAGRDSGELVGVAPAGVTATSDWNGLLDLKADVLTYFGDSVGREREAMTDLLPFLERGTNVITFSGYALAHPASMEPQLRQAFEAACKAGNSTCFFTGMDPGWATTDLALAALTGADQIDCVRVCELGYFGDYGAEKVMREYYGFGMPLDHVPVFVTGGFIEQLWAPTLYTIAEALGAQVEELKVTFESAGLDHDIDTAFGVVKAGTASVVRFELQAWHKGKPLVIAEHVDCCTREDVGKGWKAPYGPSGLVYRIEVEGDPPFSLELNKGVNAQTLASMPVINAVPVVCAAGPGVVGPLDLPRYWSRRVRR